MNIRARIFFVFAMAVIAGFTLLAYWISSDVNDRYSESFEELMVDAANLLAEVITTDMNSGDTALQQLAAITSGTAPNPELHSPTADALGAIRALIHAAAEAARGG